MDKFFDFMERPVGRVLRVGVGMALVYVGLGRMTGVAGSILAIAGVLPIAMGVWGPCLVRVAVRRIRSA